MILISVIMSIQNDENNYLKQSIESILNQSFKNFEFIIVLDGSNQDTFEKVNYYKLKDLRIRVIKQNNQGLTKSLNSAIKESKSNLIVRQDYDDISDSKRLEYLYNYMKKNTDIVLSGSNCIKINDKNLIIGKIKVENNSSKLKKQILYFNPLIHPSVIFRKNILKEFNFYNENYQVSQDYELWSKVSKKYKIGNVNSYLLRLRIHKKSVSNLNNFLQRKYSFFINLKNKFNNYEKIIDKNLTIDLFNINNLLNSKDKELLNYINSRLYVLFYDKIKGYSVFKYNVKTLILIIKYYFYRPKYLILRILNK
jgi:glycosyltransferase involved in cell wall biosynthesis